MSIAEKQDAEKKQQIVSEGLPLIYKEYAEKFQAIATQYPKTSGAAEALALVCQYGARHPDTRGLVDQAKATLIADFFNEDGLVPALRCGPATTRCSRNWPTESTNRNVQGVAFVLKMSNAKGRELTEENVDTVKPMMEKIMKDYGDVALRVPGRSEPRFACRTSSVTSCSPSKIFASARRRRRSRARTSPASTSSLATTGERSSSSISGATGEALAGPCTRTSGRS